jgi:hypothetical protein
MIYPLLGFFFVLWVSAKGMVDKYPTEDYIDKVVDGDSDSIDTFTNNIVTSIPDINRQYYTNKEGFTESIIISKKPKI